MSTVSSPRTAAARPARGRQLAVPPQHGAWAFLALPLILGLALSSLTWAGVCFAVTWVLAYPASYYLGRALTIRIRRGQWSRLARRELGYAVPWAVGAGIGALVLVVRQPVLLLVGVLLAALWAVSVWLATVGRERGFGNDLLLVGQAVVALPLLWVITTGSWQIPADVWLAAAVCATYFVGSVIHVKSLIRESDDIRWRRANIAFHLAALAWGLAAPILLLPFAAALARSIAMRPGLRPGVIGVVEIVISLLVLTAVLLATAAG